MTTQPDRATSADAEVCKLLRQGSTRTAVHVARQAMEAVLAARRKNPPATGALLDASVAGALVAMTAALATQQPRRPPGYDGGPPSADHLIAAYTGARDQNARQRQ